MIGTIRAIVLAGALLATCGSLSCQATTIGIGESPCRPCTIATDFTLPSLQPISIFLTVIPESSGGPTLDIEGGTLAAVTSIALSPPTLGAFGDADYSAVLGPLDGGSYTLLTTADAFIVSGNVSFAAGDPPSAPIPGSLALFAGGLGLIGLIAWFKGRHPGGLHFEAVAA